MTMKEMEKMAIEIKELERMREELSAEIDTMIDKIKAEMTKMGTESLVAGAFKISWKSVISSRLDTAALKKALPDVAERFSKETVARRFLIS